MRSLDVAARGWRVVAFALIALSLDAPPALATDFQANPRVELAGGYDDNVNLGTSSNAISAGSTFADARVELLAVEPTWQLRATPEVRGNWYPDHSSFDSNGEFLPLDARFSGPRYGLDLSAYLASQLLVTNYLPTASIASGLGTSQPGTTLATPASIRQNLGYLHPSYALQMTPRTGLELNLEYTTARYSDELQGYMNYKDLSGTVGLVFKATSTSSVTVRVIGGSFQPDQGLDADTYRMEGQWDGSFSATQRYYLRLGVAHTDVSGSVAGEAAATRLTTTVTGGAGVQWTYTLTDIFLDLTRDVQPTGQGYAVNRDELRLRVARRLTPRLAGFLGARAIHDEPVPGFVGPAVQSQRYAYGTLGFEWRLVRQFSLIGSYNFTNYRYSAATAQANAVSLSLVYEPHRAENSPAITIGY